MRAGHLLLTSLTITAAACGGNGPQLDAREQAAAACQAADPGTPGVATTTTGPDTAANIRTALTKTQKAADLSSDAAVLDPTWNQLHAAYSSLLDTWTYIDSYWQRYPNHLGAPSADQQRLRDFTDQGQEALGIIRAECRKAT